VHNLLGAVLLCAVFLVVWLIMPTGRQAPTTVLAASAPGAPSVATAGSATALASLPTLTRGRVMLLGGAGAFAWASARLGGFQPLPPVGPPGAAVNTNIEYLRLPPGWRSEAQGELPVQNLFGPHSKTYWLNLRHDDGSRILAQLITTPDRNKLRQYGIEACRIFHGGDVVGTRAVALGGGATATLIDTIDRRDRELHERLSVLYWEAPFSLRGRSGEMHARVALFIEQSDERLLSTVAEAGVAPGGAAFDKAATALLQLGRSITQGISQPGTPGFTVPRLVPPARPSKLPNAAASNDGRYS
jgi:hypothetical protein